MHTTSCLASLALIIASQSVMASSGNCGEKEFRKQIAETAARIVHKEAIEEIVGEFPTVEGTVECIRVEFWLTPSGSPWNISTPGSSGSFGFNLAAMRAFAKYRFKGSWWRFWEKNVVILRGIENRKPANWDSPNP